MTTPHLNTALLHITLPDGSVHTHPSGTTPLKVAENISKGLAKEALFAHVNDQPFDLNRPLTENCTLEILTRQDDRCLEYLRHDAAHVMAEAVKELFPQTQVTIGPAIKNGFYYDFQREKPFTPDDLVAIEARMSEIVDRDEPITREVWERDKATTFFQEKGEFFKAEIIADLPADQPITLYRQGDFVDLCRGPHLPSTQRLGKAFKLMKVAGSYWRGDAKNPVLQRIYGTAWATDKQLRTHLRHLEEAEKRDHRRLGKQMDLFHLQEEAVGSVFWHPNGWQLYRTIQEYMRKKQQEFGYVEVNTPQLVDRTLWEQSGHWDKFREMMFTVTSDDEKVLAIKPMNCPCHVQIFKQGTKSYRDLPFRMAEFGSCHRNEPSGALHGIMRVRAFVQDDAHIFCMPTQILQETQDFCRMLISVYKDFGFAEDQIRIEFSDRPDVRAGSDAVWDQAEEGLRTAAEASGLTFEVNSGDGAFYGPKLDFIITDAIGRDWQCGTLQLDFVLPERLDALYVGEEGHRHRPVMLHRAILGSFERFIGVLIEHHGGNFPLWLAPVQVAIATITNDFDDYATAIFTQLKAKGIRAKIDLRNEKISYKIRDLSHQKTPEIWVVGAKEQEEQLVSIRRLGSKDQETLSLEEAMMRLQEKATML